MVSTTCDGSCLGAVILVCTLMNSRQHIARPKRTAALTARCILAALTARYILAALTARYILAALTTRYILAALTARYILAALTARYILAALTTRSSWTESCLLF
jgi:hypothetical protein